MRTLLVYTGGLLNTRDAQEMHIVSLQLVYHTKHSVVYVATGTVAAHVGTEMQLFCS